MSLKAHERLLLVFKYFMLSCFLGFLISLVYKDTTHYLKPICGILMANPLLGLILTYLVPVRCSKNGCLGRMRPGWHMEGEESGFDLRMLYRCENCDYAYSSIITYGIHFGESY